MTQLLRDERVEYAVRNWAPRFTAQGVDSNDFERTVARISTWDQWCREWSATAAMHQALAEEAEASGRKLTAGEAYISAAVCYHFGKFYFMHDQAQYRETQDKSIACYAKGIAYLDPSAERVEVPFEGIKMVGYLRRPAGVSRPPVVILAPGLESTKEEFYHWENVFLKRGMATLSLEGPGQGETNRVMPMRGDYEAVATATIDFLEGRSDVDAQRVGIAGVSLGGYFAPRAAAFEHRLQAAVGICGPYNLAGRWEHRSALSRLALQYVTWAKDEAEADERSSKLTLEGILSGVRCPLLVVQGKQDRLVPYTEAERIVQDAGNVAQLVMYEEGNHVCNNIPYKYRPLVSDWMAQHLRAS
ncbi:MAG: alpha/beta hydrolase family protein [Dehalococcoidia bacterium]